MVVTRVFPMKHRSVDPVQRLTAIVRGGLKPGWRRSDVKLLREYMRRVAQLEQKAQIHLSGLFFDPEELVKENVALLELERQSLEKVTRDIDHRFWRRLLQNYVLWASLVNRGNPAAVLEPDLFEPLIRMFERGAAFTLHHGEALFECGALPLQTWRSAALWQAIELSEDKLLQWDKQ